MSSENSENQSGLSADNTSEKSEDVHMEPAEGNTNEKATNTVNSVVGDAQSAANPAIKELCESLVEVGYNYTIFSDFYF